MKRSARERELYLRLLDLASQTELETFLRNALASVVELVGAINGYLERAGDRGGDGPPWWMSQGFDEPEPAAVRLMVSRGIVAEALATGDTVLTSSALLDPRFRERQSVLVGKIEAVLCVPIGADTDRCSLPPRSQN